MGIEIRGIAILLSFVSLFSGFTSNLLPSTAPHDLLALVNRQHLLPRDFEPLDLILPAVPAAEEKGNNIYMRPEAAAALEAMFREALAQGHTLYAVSGYRSYANQIALFQSKVDRVGKKKAMLTVAPPGSSEHQLGLVIDINGATTASEGLVEAFGESPEGLWVAQNAHQFGFIIRYPKDKTDITGYAWEPWHLRYVGLDAAKEIYTLDTTLEEYHIVLWQRQLNAWIETQSEEE